MCGIFAFQGSELDRDVLLRAARAASQRGPHGWGVVGFIAGAKQAVSVSFSGRLDCDLLNTVLVEGGPFSAVVGHCRLATTGNTAGTQPIICSDESAIAHNGVVRNVEKWRDAFALDLVTDCDSEVLGEVAAKFNSLWDATEALQPDVQDYAVVRVRSYSESVRLELERSGQPLFAMRHRANIYMSSVQWHDDASLVPEREHNVPSSPAS